MLAPLLAAAWLVQTLGATRTLEMARCKVLAPLLVARAMDDRLGSGNVILQHEQSRPRFLKELVEFVFMALPFNAESSLIWKPWNQ